eukprot:TRINITY_DN30551_c0_g1_i1.p1 TRINITY_DN30551_c0_g1~~TRINITY_DN30551_c0_g1_i1.p1  ORF type:complete len:124 (+),score=5.25 TRINITY_DN30551_c0_g1_i1:37-408(+)
MCIRDRNILPQTFLSKVFHQQRHLKIRRETPEKPCPKQRQAFTDAPKSTHQNPECEGSVKGTVDHNQPVGNIPPSCNAEARKLFSGVGFSGHDLREIHRWSDDGGRGICLLKHPEVERSQDHG